MGKLGQVNTLESLTREFLQLGNLRVCFAGEMSILEPPDDNSLRPLDDRQVQALSQALRCWADRHPDSHRPLISFGGDRFVSASELAQAIQPGSDREERYPSRQNQVRRQYLRMVQMVMLETPFEEYLGSIERSGRPRFRPFRWPLELRDRIRLRRRKRERQPPPTLPAR